MKKAEIRELVPVQNDKNTQEFLVSVHAALREGKPVQPRFKGNVKGVA